LKSIYDAPFYWRNLDETATPASKTSVSATSSAATPIWIPIAAFIVSVSAFIVAVSGSFFAYTTWAEHRNADLVRIGISVLRVDPEKEKQISAAREWALNLIDANAGGVKFSPDTRAQLLKNRLEYADVRWGNFGWGSGDTIPNNPDQPAR
jgi:hypothetical protein